MLVCEVIGHVWATKKVEDFCGLKLMLVQNIEPFDKTKSIFVAVDVVGAGVGERVLVVSGSTARRAVERDDVPVDAAIVGIIDSLEMNAK